MLPYTTINEEKKATNDNRESTVYIYGLANSLDNKIFYVGKSQTPLLRRSVHIYQSKGSCETHKSIVINEIFRNNGTVDLVILEEIPFRSFDLHLAREKWWITSLINKGEILTNIVGV